MRYLKESQKGVNSMCKIMEEIVVDGKKQKEKNFHF